MDQEKGLAGPFIRVGHLDAVHVSKHWTPKMIGDGWRKTAAGLIHLHG